MRLDSTAMQKIRYLEHKYGQLSNVPEEHPYIKKLLIYGKNQPAPKLDTLITFYLTNEELKKATEITKKLKRVRTTCVREWIIEYLDNPKEINKNVSISKEERFSLNVYRKDFDRIIKLSTKKKLLYSDFLSMVVKQKISEMYKEI